ncbi:hypothetical protein [Smaragdicoccus niigatensis]|uniref:hypothetical protein n=1 Tax=Smaragdicoccus niigatensis TaxID=359359 RepID=UPI00039F14CC|nr:hypothetical protein [Smaragdicoccus niigatensis]
MWSVIAGAIIIGLIAFFTIMFQLVQHWYIVVPIGFVIWVWTFVQLDEVKAVVDNVRNGRKPWHGLNAHMA